MSALTDLFTSLANAIRAKTGGSDTYTPPEMVDAIDDVYDAGVAAGTPTLTGDAAVGDVKSGKTFYKDSTTKLTGTFAEDTTHNSATPTTSSQTINPDSGKYFSSFTVDAVSLTGNAGAGNVLSGKTYYKDSLTKQTGTMTNNGAVSQALDCGGSYTVPAGYHNGSGTVTANSLASQTGVDSGKTAVTAGAMLSGYQGWVNGSKVSGTISSKAAATYNTSASNQTISAGQYLSGAQTIRAVTTSNITAANIKDGTTVTVGDAGSSTRIANVTGTFTDASTVSSGQTAATAAKILSGYSAWVDGAEVKGTYAPSGNKALGTYTTNGAKSADCSGYATVSWTNSVSASLSQTTLWTNSSPTNEFAEQDVSLSQGLSNFSYIKITSRAANNDSTSMSAIFTVADLQASTSSSKVCALISGTKVSSMLCRKVFYKSNTSLTISKAFVVTTSGSGSYNTCAIPIGIYGLK